VNCEFGAASSPAFAPDGTEITLITNGRLVEDGIDGIRRAILPGGGFTDAVWSSSGRLAVVKDGMVRVGRTGALRPIGPARDPSWSPDGDRLTFTSGGWVELRTGTRTTRLVRGSASVFSPDGRSLAYIAAGNRVEVIPVTGGRPRPVGHVTGLAVDWQPVPANRPVCALPPGSRAIAQTSAGLVTQYRVLVPPALSGADDVYDDAYMGCLLSNGQPRLLEKFNANTIDGA
jgi:hypothetical protein